MAALSGYASDDAMRNFEPVSDIRGAVSHARRPGLWLSPKRSFISRINSTYSIIYVEKSGL
tara:strand:+ start:204 stop:386 length:183 start_codon:yes stop_codon:yes gene_type:complete